LYCKYIITGVAGQDYPNYHDIPKTNFECSGKIAGYYADTDARCQVSKIKYTWDFVVLMNNVLLWTHSLTGVALLQSNWFNRIFFVS
jgi:hypothetical protein